MKTELKLDTYSPKAHVYMDDVKEEDIDEIAGMLRGLMCAIEGWGSIKDKTNDYFKENTPVRLSFTSVENAHYFKDCVEYYFDCDQLGMRVKKVRSSRVDDIVRRRLNS